jgi:hypothetical protein|tara:strand:+ start:147 stop:404 length:258 start_codon:yes stop_codon:yes gene_type:complete
MGKGIPTKTNSPRYIKKGEPSYGKKQKVVKAKVGNKERVIRFGDANMENRSDNPERKKNFRARHGCDKLDADDKLMAKYWSCKDW